MSKYYSYLNNVEKNTVITANYWNSLTGPGQATDDLLVGSLYPFAIATTGNTYVLKTAGSNIRYYGVNGIFKNSNNQDVVSQIDVTAGGYSYKAHQIIIPGFYAWNICWGEEWNATSGDQVYAVKVRKITQTQINAGVNPELSLVVGDHRSITTSWAQTTASNRYGVHNDLWGMGFPLHTYSGMHFFNAPPYGSEYEYVLFEFSSSALGGTYFNRIKTPSITLMKVR